MSESSMFAERPMRVVCVGAGPSGLCFAYKLQRSFNNFELVVYERNAGVAGTWFENTYPGAACDFPAYSYSYSFEPNTAFTTTYPGAAETREYFQGFARKHSLTRFINLEHLVEGARWQEAAGVWELDVRNIQTGNRYKDTCHILVSATGVFNSSKMPNIKGIDSFRGQIVHTARWPKEIDLKNKRIGLIGNGSSGQQVLPAIQPEAQQVVHFIRQAAWTFGPFGNVVEPYREWTKEELEALAKSPTELLGKRKEFESFVNAYWGILQKDSEMQQTFRAMIGSAMREQLKSHPGLDVVIPTYSLGCQRPAAGIGYLEALKASNVTLIHGEIEAISHKGIKDSIGQDHELDVIICATGFDTSYVPCFPVIQQDGRNLQDVWESNNVRSYMATAVANCPNYFTLCGPMNPFGSGAFIASVEAQCDFVLKFCNRWQTENIHSMAPKEQAVDAFMDHARKTLARTVWTDSCTSWYKGHTSSAANLLAWPGSGLHFREALADPKYDHFDIKYNDGETFSWLGGGASQTETHPKGDRSYYIKINDSDAPLGMSKLLDWKYRETVSILPDESHVDPSIDEKKPQTIEPSKEASGKPTIFKRYRAILNRVRSSVTLKPLV